MKFSLVGLSTMISLMFYFVPNKGRVLSSSSDKESILFRPSLNPFATFTWSLSELGNIPKCDQGTRPSICWAGRAIYLLFRWKFAVFFVKLKYNLVLCQRKLEHQALFIRRSHYYCIHWPRSPHRPYLHSSLGRDG